jgi:hypothetical protein
MTKKQILIKTIIAGLSLGTIAFAALYILKWDIHNALYSVIWDYQLVRVYALISVTTFILLNAFRQIEYLLSQTTKSTSNSNLGGLYAYIVGTIIYAIFLEFIYDFNLRVIGLTIPIVLTTIGFNLNIVKNDSKTARKKVLIIANIILLIFWSVPTIYLTMDIDNRKNHIEEIKEDLKKVKTQYLQRGDSLWAVFSSNKEFMDNKQMEPIVLAQLKLNREFIKFQETNDYIEYIHLDYLANYDEIKTMMFAGLIIVILLNGIYLIYLIRD